MVRTGYTSARMVEDKLSPLLEQIILDINTEAESLRTRTQELLEEATIPRETYGRLPLLTLRYTTRDPFPRVVWIYTYGKSGVRAGGKSRYTREFAKPTGFKYRDKIFEPYPEPVRSQLIEIEREAAALRQFIKRTKDVIKYVKDYSQ